jgi:hypothetical protein
MEEIEELRAKFLRAYANLPAPERPQVIAVIGKENYSWNIANLEITEKTVLGIKILKKMNSLEIL